MNDTGFTAQYVNHVAANACLKAWHTLDTECVGKLRMPAMWRTVAIALVTAYTQTTPLGVGAEDRMLTAMLEDFSKNLLAMGLKAPRILIVRDEKA